MQNFPDQGVSLRPLQWKHAVLTDEGLISIHLLRDTGWFLILAIIQNVAVNVGVCIFFQICLFVFFDKYPEGELLDCMVVLVSVF